MRKIFNYFLTAFYTIKYWFRQNIHNKLSKKRNILMFTFYEAYDEHVIKYYDNIEKDKKKQYYLNYGFMCSRLNNKLDKAKEIVGDRKIKIIGNGLKSGLFLLLKSWDLIVLPDHMLVRDYMLKYIPSLFIFHGISTFLVDGEFYAYNKKFCERNGECIYTKMLENNAMIADYMNGQELFKNRVEYVSSVHSDIILNEMNNYEKYREQLGIKKEELFVFIYGTWKDISLFHVLGEEFLEQLKKIKEIGGKRIVFALSIHPKEYNRYEKTATCTPMGDLVDACACENILIRKPSTDWMPYIIGADIVIGDCSSILNNVIMANKKLILSETDTSNMVEYSVACLAYKNLPIIHKGDCLKTCLQDSINNYDVEKLNNLRKMVVEEKGFYKKRVNEITRALLCSKK